MSDECVLWGEKAGFVVKIISVTILLLREVRDGVKALRTKKNSIVNLSCGEIYSAPRL